jgi:short-subunit dehydrogenase
VNPSDTPVLVLGARSDIAHQIGKVLAMRGHPMMLAARNIESLEADVSDMATRYEVATTAHEFDVLDTDAHARFLDALPSPPAIIICAIGLLGDQEADVNDPQAIRRIVDTNYLAPCLFLEAAAARMEQTGSKSAIVGISSVAGDRGRAKNYIYGSAKAGFTAYLSGLRQKYSRSNLHIMTVKPGFVRTTMTEGMDLPGALTSDPDDFAEKVVKAMDRGAQVYCDLRWRVLMGVITHLPEKIFMRLKF